MLRRASLSSSLGLLLGLLAPLALVASISDTTPASIVPVASAAEPTGSVIAAEEGLPELTGDDSCEPEVLEEMLDDGSVDASAYSKGYCGCANSGVGNICLPAFNNCKSGYRPRCTPAQGSCGVCVCS